jgi:CRISPR-associated protein Csm5
MNYSLTCLTPTLIGNGEELAPIDYMVWKDQVNVLDQRRIFKLFARGPRLDGYLAQLKKATKLDFASWGGLAQNYAGRRIPFEHASLTRHWERASAEHLFIRTFASNSTGVYVPGTAIKGALRTGTVFTGWNENAWQSVSSQLNAGDRISRRLATQADERIAGRKLSTAGASDSTSIAVTNLRVYMTRASTLTSGRDNKLELAWKRSPSGSSKSADDATPTFIEMAQPGSVFEGVFRAKDAGSLFRAANQFAMGLLANHANYAETAKLGKLSEAVAELKARAETALESRTSCLLPLGWGGGFLGKAALTDTNSEAVRDVLKKLPFYQRAIQTGLPFPKTRRIVFLNDQPATLAGWMLLSVR